MLDVAYIGNRQTNQPINFNLNAIAPGTAFKPEFVDPRVSGLELRRSRFGDEPGRASRQQHDGSDRDAARTAGSIRC